MNNYPYDVTYDPPIPVCNVTLAAPATGYSIELTAIMDTGADGTNVLNRLRLLLDGPAELTRLLGDTVLA